MYRGRHSYQCRCRVGSSYPTHNIPYFRVKSKYISSSSVFFSGEISLFFDKEIDWEILFFSSPNSTFFLFNNFFQKLNMGKKKKKKTLLRGHYTISKSLP
jgi:hypothetical protein